VTIALEKALALCRSDPEAAARLICDLSAKVDAQQRHSDLLECKVAELERTVARLSKNSTNSSKPPSSDITRPKAQQRQQGKRKIGAQPGHPRHERPTFPETDIRNFHDYRLDACPECGSAEVTFLDQPPRVQQQMEIEKARSSDVLLDVLGKEFNGVLGCDYFSAYHKYMKDFSITVQFCIAHLIRDIRFLTGLPDAETKAYGHTLLAAVKDMFRVIHNHENHTPDAFVCALEQARETIMKAALNAVPSRLDKDGKEQKREAFNMAKRFRENGKAYFEFITTPGIGPTNNLAEQAVRFVVIDRLITQGTRSLKGRETCERLWTVVGTCALQGRSAFEFILTAVRAYFRSEPAPSLLPALG
jgi:hypothetical protein